MITYLKINKDPTTIISPWAYPGIVTLTKHLTFEVIRDAICDEFKVPFSEISSPSQKRALIEPRQILQTLAEELTSESQTKIGMYFQGRDGKYKDHSSIVHSKSIFYEHYQMEPEYRTVVRRILLKIGKSTDYFDK